MSDEPADLFRIIADSTYDWESWVDQMGRVRWINPALERITGFTVAHCLALPDYPLALAHEGDRALLERVLSDAAAGGSGNDVEFRVRRRDAVLVWVAISWQAVRGPAGEPLGYRTSIRDIEARKRIEAELHVMRRRAEAAVVARSELLANVSHELRAPVHCIAGFAELLADGTLDDAQRRYVTLIAGECASMARHVEDLLQLAALEAGGSALATSAVDLDALVRGVVEAERVRAAARGLTLSLSLALAERSVEADAMRIGQVLRNLVDNALKFSERGEVRVTAESVREDDAVRVTLMVRDHGSGMDPNDVARLLEPFQQASGTARRTHGGVGLGLAIVQRLVTAMRGTLHIDSQVGVGTSVSVSLRLAPARALVPVVPTQRRAVTRGERALVVDDSGPARELLRAQLERAGYLVTEAASGSEALVHAARARFELVLLDYQMPGSDGAETALALQRVFAAQKERPRVYLLTANVFAREQLASARWAFDGILEKPVSRDALIALIAREVPPRAPHHAVRAARLRGLLDARVVDDLCTMRRADGTSMLAGVLGRVRADQAAALDALNLALAAGDLAQAARAAHAVAGNAAMIGAQAVARRARRLEQRITLDPRDAEGALQGMPVLRRAWERAVEMLEARVSEGER